MIKVGDVVSCKKTTTLYEVGSIKKIGVFRVYSCFKYMSDNPSNKKTFRSRDLAKPKIKKTRAKRGGVAYKEYDFDEW